MKTLPLKRERPPTHVDLRRRLKKKIDALPDRMIPSVADIVDGLECVEATRELLEIHGMLESHRRGMKDIAEGRTTSWRKVFRNV